MSATKDIIYDRGVSRDSQFLVWRLSIISGSQRTQASSSVKRQKSSIRLTDVDLLSDEIIFPDCSIPIRLKGLNLSLKQTTILATMLPNAIINISDLSKEKIDTFVGVLLFADISGFTKLCEKYNAFGKSASDKISATLNTYLGAMVEVIYKCGGDVLKFSGDAFLALWKLEKNEYIYSLIHRVICCAFYIQNSIGVYETDVKVSLKVKLAISAGNMTFSVIGDHHSRHYLVVGSPVYEVKLAERVCLSGEIVLSDSAWGHLSPVNYEHNFKDKRHVKIMRIIYNPENSKREVLRAEVRGGFQINIFSQKDFTVIGNMKKGNANSVNIAEVRSVIEEVTKKKLSSDFRSFLIPSVIQQIDADLPIEYLSEMRNVTVMFVNIVPHRLHTRKLITLVDRTYTIICSLSYKAMGSVNKVSLFDKDIMILIIFGLRGFNHDGEVAACLKCAYDVRQACCSLDGVFSVSIGVTTGQAYCGVIGHPLRREYTVIGAVVNKAARMMCAYPGKVSCDRDTYLLSNLATSFFTLLEKKSLKGIAHTGPVYEFSLEKSKNTLVAMNEGVYPILGRDQEIRIFLQILDSINKSKSWEKAILVRGTARIGKTRLLDEMIFQAHKKGFKPIVIALHTFHSTLAYGTAHIIIKQILDIPDFATTQEKEQRILNVLGDHIPLEEYWYLNEVMNVNFLRNDLSRTLNPVEKFERIKKLFHIILKKGTKSVIFAIDDVNFCDELSWKLILSVIDKRIKFLIMTMPKRLSPELTESLKIPPEIDSHILKVTLSGLPHTHLASLACQILNAKAVPVELERVLITKSHGNPGWCESYLLSLCQSNILKVEKLPIWYIKSLGLIIPSPSSLELKHYIINQHDRSDQNLKEEKEKYSENQELLIAEEKNFSRDVDNLMNIEEAYEDLCQRIELVRFQSKFRLPASHIELEPEDYFDGMEVLHKEETEAEQVIRTGKNMRDESGETDLKYDPAEMTLAPVISDEESLHPASDSLENNDLIEKSDSEKNINERISAIHRRFSSKRYSLPEENQNVLTESELQLIVKSLEDLRNDNESFPIMKSKSIVGIVHVGCDINSTTSDNVDEHYLLHNEDTEFSASSLWKSHTQCQINHSIRLFIDKKRKAEKWKRQVFTKSKEHISSLYFPTTSSVITGINSTLKDDYNEITEKETLSKSVIFQTSKRKGAFVGDERNTIHNATRDITSKSDQSPNDENITNFNNSANQMKYIKHEKKSSESSTLKPYDKRKSWLLRIFDKMKKHNSESITSISVMAFSSEVEENNDLIPAILINPNIKLDEVATPECFVRVIMSAFDVLTPYEQLMLKCGSVIGEKFKRKMLCAIMHDLNPVLTAEAVRRLFEMRILCCAADTIESEYENLHDCRCMCPLSSGDIVDETLPRYSFCQALLFKYAMFRVTLYELIPLDQKREFHVRAVEFLEKEQIRCFSCYELFKTDHRFSMPQSEQQNKSDSERSQISREKYLCSQFKGMKRRKKDQMKKNALTPLILPKILPNFHNCECLVLQADNLKQLISHSVAAGLKKKEIEFIINYSALMITLGEFKEAKSLLEQAELKMKSVTEGPISKKKERRIIMGRIYLLFGRLHLELNLLKKASIYLQTALKYFGSHFLQIHPFRSLQYLHEWSTTVLHPCYQGVTHKKPKVQFLNDQRAICLSLLCNIFMLQNKWEFAKLMALRSLNNMRRNNYTVTELCNAYSNAIDIYRHFGKFKACRKLELAAAKGLIPLFTYETALEIIAIGRLTCSVLNARLISGHLYAACHLGESVITITQSVSCPTVESYVMPHVVYIMMVIGKLNKAAKIILCIPVQDIWHHILSLEFILETGFVLESSEICLNAIASFLDGETFIDTDTQRRAISTVYVWLMRVSLFAHPVIPIRHYNEAEIWGKKLPQNLSIPYCGDTINNMITVLKILEGDLLKLASLQETDPRRNPFHRKITTIFKAFTRLGNSAEIILPRFLHLRAYYNYRTSNLSKALITLDYARKISAIQGNFLEQSWISHSKKVWNNKYDFDEDYWRTSALNGKLMKWTEDHDLSNWGKNMYSLG